MKFNTARQGAKIRNRKEQKLARQRFRALCEQLEDRRMLSFTPGDLAVLRLGGVDGDPSQQSNAAITNSNPTAMFIDEYTPAGAYVQSVALPTSGASTLTGDGSGFTSGFLGRTVDGQNLLIPGYRKDITESGTPATDSALASPRVIGLMDKNENLNATTALTESFSTNSFRTVASVDGTSFYVTGANVTNGQYAGQGGLRYVASLGASTSTPLSTNPSDNLREVAIINGNLFITSGATVPGRTVTQVGTGLPTTAAASTYSQLFPVADSNTQYNSFKFFDLSPTNGDPRVGGADTLYIVDSNSQGGQKSQVDKYTYSNATSSWTLTSRLPELDASNGSLWGITGFANGSTVSLYLTTTEAGTGTPSTVPALPSKLLSLTDASGYGNPATASFTPLVTLNDISSSFFPNNTIFKGIQFVPSAAPVVTAGVGGVAYTENGSPLAVAPSLTVTDPDAVANDITGATVKITGNFVPGEDVLSFTAPGGSGITGFYDPTLGVLTLSGTSSLANYQTALRSVSYSNSSDNPSTATRTLSYVTYDVSIVPSAAGTRTVSVTAVNDVPVITMPPATSVGTNDGLTFATINANAITVADVDSNAAQEQLTLSVTAGTLTLSTLAGLTGSGNGTASMTYTGTITALNAALDHMLFSAPGSLTAVTLNASLNDLGNTGTGGAHTGTNSLSITVNSIHNVAPVVTTTGGAMSYTENAAAANIDSTVTVTDGDDANLTGASVSITSGFNATQDSLSFTNQNGITGLYNATTGVMTLTGLASVSTYQAALQSVKYINSSDNPTTSRTVTFIVGDGTNTGSNTRNITIVAVDDAPVNTVPSTQSVTRDGTHVFSTANGNAIVLSDVDATSAQLTLSVPAGHTLTLSTLSGLSGSGNGTNSLTYSGTIVALNAALNGLVYTPPAAFTGAATLTVSTNDLGATGTGGPLTTNTPITINTLAPVPLVINEIMTNPPGGNAPNQYIEIRAVPGLFGSSYAGGVYTIPAGTYLANIEGDGGPGPNPGDVSDLFDLGGFTTGANGILVLAQFQNYYKLAGFYDVTNPSSNVIAETSASGFGNNADPLAAPNNSQVHHSADSFSQAGLIEDPSGSWFLYQSSVAATVNDDIDADNNGTPDGNVYANWVVSDSIGVTDDSNDITDYSYAAITFSDIHGLGQARPGTTVVPVDFTAGYLARTGNTTGSSATDWVAGVNTSGVNPPVPGSPVEFTLSKLTTSLSGYAGVAVDSANSGVVQAGIGSPNFGNTYITPVIDINGTADGRDYRTSFVQGGGAVSVGNPTGLQVLNYGNPGDMLQSATVTISNLLDGSSESLAATTTGTPITANYVAATGVLTLSGSATLAQYQQVLRTVAYNNTAASPNLTSRTLTFSTTDGTYTSLPSVTTLGMFSNQFAVRINEIDVNPPGDDNPYEYVEIIGPANFSLNNFYFASVEGDDVNPSTDPLSPSIGQTGRVTYAANLTGQSLGSDGLLIIKSPTGGFTAPSGTTVVTDPAFDNTGGTLQNGTNSFFLVYSPSTPITAFVTDPDTGDVITAGTDFDTSGGGATQDNGTLTMPSGAQLVDNVAWFDGSNTDDIAYGSVAFSLQVGAPSAATRLPGNLSRSADAWYYGQLNNTTNSEVAYNGGLIVNLPASSSNLPSGAVLTPGGPNFGPTLAAPEVTGIYARGSSWNSTFLNYLSSHALGSSTLGFALQTGSTQLKTLPWTNINTISVQFSEDVTINSSLQSNLGLIGSTDLAAPPASTGFSYNSTTHVATWTFSSALTRDKYLLNLPSSAVTNTEGTPLDGEFTNTVGATAGSSFPSGNGAAGGSFNFRFNMLPGDADRNNAVTGLDGNGVRQRLGQNTSGATYTAFFDTDGNGAITGLDGNAVRARLGQGLPSTEPVVPANMMVAISLQKRATDHALSQTQTFDSFDEGDDFVLSLV